MNMLSFLSSQKSIFGLIFLLLISFSTTNAEASYGFSYKPPVENQEVQTFEASAYAPMDAARDEFWFPKMVWPVTNHIVSSGFGYRESSCRLCSTEHRGVDFTPGRGSEIYAVMEGTVLESGNSGSYGTVVVIEHPNGWKTLYAHMIPGSNSVSVGQHVNQGQVIGLVGNSGVSTGAHLHFEIVIDRIQKNPLPILNEWTSRQN